ncbi:Ldh family oxidoreductase [Acuticoccus mangrovi]|uniref:Ldh family oxidoreductase n=1 Tax=Acuticoccus mangrovi TaxID=2796142 RepID=A0A934IKS8_9HYPH|nr:Ldh family oxidoreductase [Acuticoccus mangrovi]
MTASYPPRLLAERCTALLTALGVAPDDARQTVDVFLQAEQMGEESHGLRLFEKVLHRVKAGGDKATAGADVVSAKGAIALLDAHQGLGQVAAAQAMRLAMDKAHDFGIGMVTVRNANSFTSAKYYPLMAAQAGMVGIAYTNTSRKMLPPPGGVKPVLGNNPAAYAAPAPGGAFVLDFACTEAAAERIVKAKERGEPIPEGWALDSEGRETTDPAEALKSLAFLPFGGYKAFGLAMVHEIMTSVIAGGPLMAGEAKGFAPYDAPMNTAFTLIAIDIAAFIPRAEFEARMGEMIAAIKASPLREGASEIRYPGERSARAFEANAAAIPVDPATIALLDDWARQLDLPTLV